MSSFHSSCTIEVDELDDAPEWLIDLLEHSGYIDVSIEAEWSRGYPATRTDPEDPGELSFTLFYLVPGASRVEIEKSWLTLKCNERIYDDLESQLNSNLQAEDDGYGDYLYEQEKDRRMNDSD